MEKYLLISSTKHRERSPSPVRIAQPIYLGILGSRNDMTMEEIDTHILQPLVQQFGKAPEKIIVPTEGNSSIYISDWAERQDIPTQVYTSDWRRDGRRARVVRDSHIIQEATHIVCVNGPRSTYYESLGARNVKKKSGVFVLEHATKQLAELEA